jgi:predicted phage terminase large subunit-like protein
MSGLDAIDKVDRLLKQVDRVLPASRAAGGAGGGESGPPRYESLLDVYRAAYPNYLEPHHLAPAIEVYERAKREAVRAVIVEPRRAGKTELECAASVDRLLLDPTCMVTFAMYGQRPSEKRSARMRKLFRKLGGLVDGATDSRMDWRVDGHDGGLWATSVGGAVVGEGSRLLLLDDLLRGRADAESEIIRERTFDWLMADALPTLEPNGSAILTTTRWHEDDPAGRLVRDHGWELVHTAALTRVLPGGGITTEPARDESDRPYWPLATTRSYWPERWSVERLLQTCRELGGPDGYDWVSLYQGAPRSASQGLFRGVEYGPIPHRSKLKVAVGVDFGYSANKRSDWSVAIALGWDGKRFYVLEVLRLQTGSPEVFAARVAELVARWNCPDMVGGYIAPTEKGNRAVFREVGLYVRFARAQGKVTGALPVAAAWSRHDVVLPESDRGQKWVEQLVAELAAFPQGLNDDQVDAIASAHGLLYGLPAFAVDEDTLPKDPIQRAAAEWERDVERSLERERKREDDGGFAYAPTNDDDWGGYR